MAAVEQLVERVRKTQNGFGDIRKAADEIIAENTPDECAKLAKSLYASEVHQARMLATFIFGHLAAKSDECFQFLYEVVSKDSDWRVQEILAQAFDLYCKTVGYEAALPMIEAWIGDGNANVRRAATEGLRIWTTRPYFKAHPDVAIRLLSQRKADESEYVRKSVGNALRDISRKFPELVRSEVEGWDTSDKKVAQTHKLASRFL